MAKVAIVTGSDSGIGQVTALALAEAGCDVGITWHTDQAGAEEAASGVRAAGQRAEIDQVDLSDPVQGAGVVDQLAATIGGLDILVNCAGTGSLTPFLELGFDEWRHVLTVDLDGAFACSQVAARRMKAEGAGGRIINITSVHEHVGTSSARAPSSSRRRRSLVPGLAGDLLQGSVAPRSGDGARHAAVG